MIDIDYRNINNPASTKLSNLYPHTFTIDDVPCNSMEGFLQSLKEPDPIIQRDICLKSGMQARRVRSKYHCENRVNVYWNSRTYDRHSELYTQLLVRSYTELTLQNSDFRSTLVGSYPSELCHSIGNTDPTITILTQFEFVKILTDIRHSIYWSDVFD